MAGMDIDRLEKLAPSKFMEELMDQWPGKYEKLYSDGFRTQKQMVAEMRRQTSGCCKEPSPKKKRRIGTEAAAQNDS